MSAVKKPRLDSTHLGFVHNILGILAENAESAGTKGSNEIADKIKAHESRKFQVHTRRRRRFVLEAIRDATPNI